MRETKFRAWDKRHELNPDLYGMVEWEDILSNLWLYLSGKYDYIVPLQYIGLKDSEDTEEYFGDIVETRDSIRWVIEDGLSAVLYRNPQNNAIKYFWEMGVHKVIGNIYENPELLENK